MIRVSGLRKSYGTTVAVDGVSLDIRRGETFGLLGPNGAGKTTTLHCLVGALRPDSGRIEIETDSDPTRPGVRRKIGVAPQRLSLYEELTAEENLRFFGQLYGLSGAALAERVEWSLQFSQLTERRRHRVGTYSGGMQRRLNMACALIHDPPVLLFDEPTVGVDPQSRNHIFDSIEQLKTQGRTIVYTTHYMEEAQRLCDRIAIIDKGRVLDVDTVDALIERHGGSAVVQAELEKAPADPSILPGELDGLSLRFDAEEPLTAAVRLSQAGVKFKSLHLDRPDLESVFLKLTGRSLRD